MASTESGLFAESQPFNVREPPAKDGNGDNGNDDDDGIFPIPNEIYGVPVVLVAGVSGGVVAFLLVSGVIVRIRRRLRIKKYKKAMSGQRPSLVPIAQPGVYAQPMMSPRASTSGQPVGMHQQPGMLSNGVAGQPVLAYAMAPQPHQVVYLMPATMQQPSRSRENIAQISISNNNQ
jgi:hypothetical protein